MNGAELLCKTLEAHGVTHVFGVPGTQTVLLHEALRRSRIRVVLATHELAASFMANGYFRASGRVAPLVTIPGPGFAYALAGLAEARQDSTALLHVSGRAPGIDHRRHFQALDQRAIAGPLVKATFLIDEGAEIPSVVDRAMAAALTGEPGPVLLEWTAGALEAAVAATPAETPASSSELDLGGVERVAGRLAEARRPVLLVGQGCIGGAERLQELAELLPAPVLTTSSGRGVLAEDHPLALGFDLAHGPAERVNELLRACDLVLAVGCKLGAAGSGAFSLALPSERLVRIDASRESLEATYPASVEIVSTAESFLVALAAALARRTGGGGSSWSPDEVDRWRRRLRAQADEPEPAVHGARPATAGAFFAALRRALPRDGIVVADSGLHQTLLRRHFTVLAARGLVFPSDFQSMGFGLPAAIGARLGAPARPVVAVIGDGGFAMTGMELLTAVREKLPLTVVVFADAKLNRIRMEQLARFGHTADVDILNPDFAALAAAVGARHLRCQADAEEVLGRAIGSGEVTLVEVPVGDSLAVRMSRIRGLAKSTARRVAGPALHAALRGSLRRSRREAR